MIRLDDKTITGLSIDNKAVDRIYDHATGELIFGEEPAWMPLTFTANTAGSTISMQSNMATAPSLQYSLDNENWSNWTYTTSSNIHTFSTITLANVGDNVYFRGTNTAFGTYNKESKFVMTGSIAASGDITSLLHPDGNILDLSQREYAFKAMFHQCSSLTSAPELPSTVLVDYCYRQMFEGCNYLTSAPELPAMTLDAYCYMEMFKDCYSLITAPELPATTLTNNCYYRMFKGCNSLTTAPELPAMTLSTSCYNEMFRDCTSLTTAPELPATSIARYCYAYMFSGCSSLTTAPELPATTLADYCYNYMFSECSSLTTAPELPATTLAGNCYSFMFRLCTNLSSVEVGALVWNTDNTYYWLTGVNPQGTFTKPSGTTIPSGDSGIPTGWTVIELSPAKKTRLSI